jgi:hypothetical protein
MNCGVLVACNMFAEDDANINLSLRDCCVAISYQPARLIMDSLLRVSDIIITEIITATVVIHTRLRFTTLSSDKMWSVIFSKIC